MNFSKIDLTKFNYNTLELDLLLNIEEEVRKYRTNMHIIGCISVVVNSAAVYIILKHSPPQIGVYRVSQNCCNISVQKTIKKSQLCKDLFDFLLKGKFYGNLDSLCSSTIC